MKWPAGTGLWPEDKTNVSVADRCAARIISSNWHPHRITLVAEAAEPALVLMAQAFYHNWRTYVGDRPTPLLRATYTFQALEIPATRFHRTVSRRLPTRAVWLASAATLPP